MGNHLLYDYLCNTLNNVKNELYDNPDPRKCKLDMYVHQVSIDQMIPLLTD